MKAIDVSDEMHSYIHNITPISHWEITSDEMTTDKVEREKRYATPIPNKKEELKEGDNRANL
jgi:hypothetical protein